MLSEQCACFSLWTGAAQHVARCSQRRLAGLGIAYKEWKEGTEGRTGRNGGSAEGVLRTPHQTVLRNPECLVAAGGPGRGAAGHDVEAQAHTASCQRRVVHDRATPLDVRRGIGEATAVLSDALVGISRARTASLVPARVVDPGVRVRQRAQILASGEAGVDLVRRTDVSLGTGHSAAQRAARSDARVIARDLEHAARRSGGRQTDVVATAWRCRRQVVHRRVQHIDVVLQRRHAGDVGVRDRSAALGRTRQRLELAAAARVGEQLAFAAGQTRDAVARRHCTDQRAALIGQVLTGLADRQPGLSKR